MKYSYHHIVSIQTSKRWREEQDRNNNINNKRNIDMQKKTRQDANQVKKNSSKNLRMEIKIELVCCVFVRLHRM